jgi:hypothetical protein
LRQGFFPRVKNAREAITDDFAPPDEARLGRDFLPDLCLKLKPTCAINFAQSRAYCIDA